MLKLVNVEVRYHGVILVIRGVSFDVPAQQIVCLLGANGAGKTTILKAISGVLHTEDGKISDGFIEFEGKRIDKAEPYDVAKLGILQVWKAGESFNISR